MQYRPVRAVTIVRAASAATRIPLEYKLTAWRNIRGTEAVAAAASGDTTVASIAEKLADEVERTDPTVHAFLDFDRRSEEHTSELQSLMRISYAVFCLKNT